MNPDPYRGLWGGKYCRDSPVQTNRDCDCITEECKASNLYYEQLEEVIHTITNVFSMFVVRNVSVFFLS